MLPDTSRTKPFPSLTQVSFKDLAIDTNKEIERISSFIRETLVYELKKRGTIIALSGGIDSSVTAALCVKALGADRVIGLLMPESHSSSDSSRLAQILGNKLGIQLIEKEITDILKATGCYTFQDEAIKALIPQYEHGYPFKIVLPFSNKNEKFRIFSLVVQTPDGTVYKERMTHDTYLKLVAATNFKQRARKMMEYYYADRFNYAVAGSPNRLEYDQGFFVKGGDGSADIKPIAHLYKSQVYALAESLNIPYEIRSRRPTTDTYPMEQSQEEFYFSLPYEKMDICLYAKNCGHSPESVCGVTDLTPAQAQAVFNDIETKRKTTRYQHLSPILVEKIPGIGA
jgi:NAD+ synthase